MAVDNIPRWIIALNKHLSCVTRLDSKGSVTAEIFALTSWHRHKLVEDMSPAQRDEWFRTRMQDPVFVAGLEQRQRDMEELDEEFHDSAEDELEDA